MQFQRYHLIWFDNLLFLRRFCLVLHIACRRLGPSILVLYLSWDYPPLHLFFVCTHYSSVFYTRNAFGIGCATQPWWSSYCRCIGAFVYSLLRPVDHRWTTGLTYCYPEYRSSDPLLNVASPPKQLSLTRLAYSTTSDDILAYIKLSDSIFQSDIFPWLRCYRPFFFLAASLIRGLSYEKIFSPFTFLAEFEWVS